MSGNKEEAACTHLPCGDKEQSPDCLLASESALKLHEWTVHSSLRPQVGSALGNQSWSWVPHCHMYTVYVEGVHV